MIIPVCRGRASVRELTSGKEEQRLILLKRRSLGLMRGKAVGRSPSARRGGREGSTPQRLLVGLPDATIEPRAEHGHAAKSPT